ncbi:MULTISPECIES: peptidase M50 [Acidianus]|uniref:Peptidase M50 n=1 Tax=Candidatus Acidianus copahuensis TaxID=1160895 RepID=A0A031LLY6_9CREN|nr:MULTISPECIES: peptidase M50 [Acidianus]EZQ01888.1 peptidase M50 [Candidatus Acidianus copahuensis]NON62061.1 peptidase M50 [Acidianus sp. RZ1]
MSRKLEYWEYEFRNLSEITSILLAVFSVAVVGIRNLIAALVTTHVITTFDFIGGFIFPVVAAVLAIIPHEIAHRQVARRYGCYSRFTLSFTGFLATTIINLIAFFGLVFFSGYTLIACRFFSADNEINGKTAAAGPATNIALALLFYVLSHVTPFFLLNLFFFYVSAFNAFVAFFNLLPFWVLDGLKVFKWNIAVWAIMIVISLAIMFLTGQI